MTVKLLKRAGIKDIVELSESPLKNILEFQFQTEKENIAIETFVLECISTETSISTENCSTKK